MNESLGHFVQAQRCFLLTIPESGRRCVWQSHRWRNWCVPLASKGKGWTELPAEGSGWGWLVPPSCMLWSQHSGCLSAWWSGPGQCSKERRSSPIINKYWGDGWRNGHEDGGQGREQCYWLFWLDDTFEEKAITLSKELQWLAWDSPETTPSNNL